jgi:2-polyprenyl-3-methyl-5-hydroxy-6-metoxy-1,4-benzoquinol methylase
MSASFSMRDHRQSVKEVIRHVMHFPGLDRLYLLIKRLRGAKIRHLLETRNLESTFESIYKSDFWLQGTSKSGPGSDFFATCRVIEPLKKLLGELQCKCLVDIGCGDFNWMQQVLANGTFRYVGCDVVRSIIDDNVKKYQTERVTFKHLNACEEPIPSGDVIICREVLFHLSFDDIARLINNVRCFSTASYFIATLDTSTWFNSNIKSGDFRYVNLLIRPFGFPEPLMTISDNALRAGRTLAVWKISQLPISSHHVPRSKSQG